MIYDGLEGATELEISVKEILYGIEVLLNLRKKAVFLTCDSKPAFFCLPFLMINTTRQANPDQYI